MRKSIGALIMEYFEAHPNEDLAHAPVVDWVEEQCLLLNGFKPRDTWRNIRSLHQQGRLIKVRKGIYRYDPAAVSTVELFGFPPVVKQQIFARDGFRCIVCGRGEPDGVELCADHKTPRDKGGTNAVENGQTLCAEHNLLKKNYSRTEAGKRYVTELYLDAVRESDVRMMLFCKELLDVYDRHGINGHISRPDR